MAKQIKGNMSDAEERLLIALYTPSMYTYVAHGYMPMLRGRGVAEICGGAWSSYRHKIMVKLAEKGWVKMEKVTVGTVTHWVYSMSDVGFNTMGERVKLALKNHVANSEKLFDVSTHGKSS